MDEYSVKTLYNENKYLHLMETTCPNGVKWCYAKRANTKGGVIIIPLILDLAEPYTIFLKSKRPPLIAENISEFNIEFPAGLVGDENKDETFDEALKKELLEETGLCAKEFIIKTNKLTSSAGCVSETAMVAVAKITNSKIVKQPVDDGGIIADRIYVPVSEITDFIRKCETEHIAIGAQTLAGIYYLWEELSISNL